MRPSRIGAARQPRVRIVDLNIHAQRNGLSTPLIEEMQVLPDFREPDNIRLGLAPLYTSFSEVWQVIDRIRRVVVEQRYLKYPQERTKVT
mgnify:CR=1 FL=1